MQDGKRPYDVAILGGGLIGLAVAWRTRARGLSVLLVERGRIGEGASRVAAGMLAPVSEVEYGEHGRRSLELGLRSAAAWPAFAEELADTSGMAVGLRRTGTLLVAHDDDEARELERQFELRTALGLRAERLRSSEAREREPALTPTVRLALEAPDDHSVDPRLVLAALREACVRGGVEIREQVGPVSVSLSPDKDRVKGLALGASSERVEADVTAIAAGAWSGALDGLPGDLAVPVRPVKGQIMALRDPAGPGLLTRAVRYRGGYLVGRGDGRYVLGGTVEEKGFDRASTVGAVYELLRRAYDVVPGVSELELTELNVGFRPGTPDNAPIVGRAAVDGLLWATGHYRNGVLLTPLTAELVAGLLTNEASDPALELCDPARFAHTPSKQAVTT